MEKNSGKFVDYRGFTFDDVLLVPGYSEVVPSGVNVATKLTPQIDLNIPICSAAMDTVTEARLAIALAREGGIGILHRNLPLEAQAVEVDKVCEIYAALREKCGISLCASHGLLAYNDFVKLKAAGVTRIHNNLETSRRNFPNVCTTHSYDDKIAAIKAAMRAGLEVCSGGIIGMGESFADRADMAFELRALGVKSVPLNVLNPIPGTPYEKLPRLAYNEIRRAAALFRFILPDAAIRMAGGRGLLVDKGRAVFRSGANAAISGDMLTTAGISVEEDMKMIKELGYEVKRP